jgi:hypothetical protein
MERWSTQYNKHIEDDQIDSFLLDLVLVYKKHGLSIGHEDRHGAFEIEEYQEANVDWLMSAHDSR